MTVAPRLNSPCPHLSSTRALQSGGNRPDQMMAHTTLPLHVHVFLSCRRAKADHLTSWFDPPGNMSWHGSRWSVYSLFGSQPEEEGGIRVLAFNQHPCFVRANKGGLHPGLSSRLELVLYAICVEQPAIRIRSVSSQCSTRVFLNSLNSHWLHLGHVYQHG